MSENHPQLHPARLFQLYTKLINLFSFEKYTINWGVRHQPKFCTRFRNSRFQSKISDFKERFQISGKAVNEVVKTQMKMNVNLSVNPKTMKVVKIVLLQGFTEISDGRPEGSATSLKSGRPTMKSFPKICEISEILKSEIFEIYYFIGYDRIFTYIGSRAFSILLYSYCSYSCRQLYSTRGTTRDENNNYHRVLGTLFQSIARSRKLASSYELNSQVNPASRRLCWPGPAAQWHSRLLLVVTSRIRYVSIRDNW